MYLFHEQLQLLGCQQMSALRAVCLHVLAEHPVYTENQPARGLVRRKLLGSRALL
jgi:hypothetical protein